MPAWANSTCARSSRIHRRQIPAASLQTDQYLNWTGGAGYTIRQGLRVGAQHLSRPLSRPPISLLSSRRSRIPRTLPATGLGVDAQWGRGPWNVNAEWQRFQMDYHAMPTFIEDSRLRRSPPACSARAGTWPRASAYVSEHMFAGWRWYEAAVGYRPGRHELVKVDYEAKQGTDIYGAQQNTLAVQFVTTLGPLSFAAH